MTGMDGDGTARLAAEADLERRARARIIKRNVYWGVMALWVLAAILMAVIWWVTTPGGYFWPGWGILGMGLAALSWGISTSDRSPFRVRRDQVEREMARLREEERPLGEGPGHP